MARSACQPKGEPRRRPVFMLHAGLDLSRRRLDFCLLDERGERVEGGVAPPDREGLIGLARRVEQRHGRAVVAAIESMNGARFVHDTLEPWAGRSRSPTRRRSRGWRRWRARPTGSTPGCWPSSPGVSWCRRSGCPIRGQRASANAPAGGCTWSSAARSSIASTRSFGVRARLPGLRSVRARGRELLARLDFPEPWRGGVDARSR